MAFKNVPFSSPAGRYPAKVSMHMIPQIRQLLKVISTGALDRETIEELFRIIDDRGRWKDVHALFSRIRHKTLQTDACGDQKLIAQY